MRRGKGSIFSVFGCTKKEAVKVHTTDDLQSGNPQWRVLIVRLADESSIRVTWNRIPLLHRPKRLESHFYLQKTLPNIWCNWQDQRNGEETWHGLAERYTNKSKHISSDDNRLTNLYFQLTFKNTYLNCSKTQFLPQSKEPVPRSYCVNIEIQVKGMDKIHIFVTFKHTVKTVPIVLEWVNKLPYNTWFYYRLRECSCR